LSGDVSVLLGGGDGTFRSQVRFPVGPHPAALLASDFNGDGTLDLAAVSESHPDSIIWDQVSVLLGRGDGTFEPPQLYPVDPIPAGGPPGQVVGNFDGDGIPDLVIANRDSGDLSLLRGRGDGTFEAERRCPLKRPSSAFVAGDFNRDGRLDLVTGDPLGD